MKHTEKIILEDIRRRGYPHDHFKVTKLINSVQYMVGEYLSTEEVENLIAKDWTVEIRGI
jgi:hypothetical protein